MRNKRDMYVDYNRSYKKHGRRAFRTVLLVTLLLSSGSIIFYQVVHRLVNLEQSTTSMVMNSKQEVSARNPVINPVKPPLNQSKSQSREEQTVAVIQTGNQSKGLNKDALKGTEKSNTIQTAEIEQKEDTVKVKVTTAPVKVKGIYVTANRAGSEKMKDLIDIATNTEINAIVIDIKNEEGKITYRMDSALVKKYGSNSNVISDIQTLIKELKEKDIYTIARVVAFKDTYLAKKNKKLAIKMKDGSLYHDNMKGCWVNPYKKQVWDYLVEVGTQAAAAGFDEIQFDYMRFPTDGAIAQLNLGSAAHKTKEEAIVEFTKYAYEKLKPLGVFISADVYGTIIRSSEDASVVGQNYVELSKILDYICPMIYPSHFGEGNFGIQYPDLEPRKIIRKVLEVSKTKLEQIPEGEHRAIVRPWLQDFTATWVKPHKTYGGKEVRAQIKGVHDSGYEEWILWNASCKYSVDGFQRE